MKEGERFRADPLYHFQFYAYSDGSSSEILANQVVNFNKALQSMALMGGGNNVRLTEVLSACVFLLTPGSSDLIAEHICRPYC